MYIMYGLLLATNSYSAAACPCDCAQHIITHSILAFHCLTSCDSTSSFIGKGKGKLEAWKQFLQILKCTMTSDNLEKVLHSELK